MPQVSKEKRPRQDLSPPVTEVSSEEFQLHTKRPKTFSVPGPIGEKEASSTTVTKVDRPTLGVGLQKVITSTLLKKSIDSPLTTHPSKVRPKLSIFEKYEQEKEPDPDQQYLCPVLEADIICTT
jgi:hypothetical protein